MSSVDTTHDLSPLLRWVLATLDQRQPVAVRHPLGFVCLPLARDQLNVCVHVWAAGLGRSSPTTSQVHCHSWDLTSHVLYGRLRNELVRVDDDPAEPTHRVFEIHSDGDRDAITPTRRLVRWRHAAAASYRAGDTYEVPAGSFHMTAVPNGHEVATVLLARRRPDVVDLSLGGPDLAGHTVARERCDPDETALAVSTVYRRLASGVARNIRPEVGEPSASLCAWGRHGKEDEGIAVATARTRTQSAASRAVDFRRSVASHPTRHTDPRDATP